MHNTTQHNEDFRKAFDATNARYKAQQAEHNTQTLKSVGPYTWVSRDVTSDKGQGVYRFIVYGAYNAFGLIGSELNGIAVLDETNKRVLCDGIQKTDSGYFGPSQRQLETLVDLVCMPYDKFAEFINQHPNARYALD